jgi:hypothetical protein
VVLLDGSTSKSIPLTCNFFDVNGNAGNVLSATANLAYVKNGTTITELISLAAPNPPDFQWRAAWNSNNADAINQVVDWSVQAKFADGTVSVENGSFRLTGPRV